MRCLKRNKRPFYYCLYKRTDVVTDDYGNETGQHVLYEAAVPMNANVSAATGWSNNEQFGNLENYDKVIVTDDMSCPISETSVLFVDKEPEYSVRNNDPMYDYIVIRVAKSINSISIAIRKVDVS